MEKFKLWESPENREAEIDYYPSAYKIARSAAIIFPGGGYEAVSVHEGLCYAEFFNTFGMDAFVVKYRVAPNRFPLPLLDARRAVKFVRANADKFGLDKEKIVAVGSSAGGHLAALLSTYTKPLEGDIADEIGKESFLPNGQVLCYPVISSDEKTGHKESYRNLLGEKYSERDKYSPETLVTGDAPKAFLWHTSTDNVVSVTNSYLYAEALHKCGVPCELHVFPLGAHGSGVAPHIPYVATWIDLLRKWLILNGFIEL